MTRQQERFMQMEINFANGNNQGYIPSSLGGRSISVGKQKGRQWDEKFHVSTTLISVNSKA